MNLRKSKDPNWQGIVFRIAGSKEAVELANLTHINDGQGQTGWNGLRSIEKTTFGDALLMWLQSCGVTAGVLSEAC